MVLVLNDVTSSVEDRHIWRDITKKFKKYNYLTIAENMAELDGAVAPPSPKKFKYFTRKRKETGRS